MIALKKEKNIETKLISKKKGLGGNYDFLARL
jgi:hypothetical protein